MTVCSVGKSSLSWLKLAALNWFEIFKNAPSISVASSAKNTLDFK